MSIAWLISTNAMLQFRQMRNIAPDTERARSRTWPPSFPDFTIQRPLDAWPVIMPT
jgi:hypothetical protein